MKILLTGVNSYIGSCLLPVLLERGHQVVCLVREHFSKINNHQNLSFIRADLARLNSTNSIPKDIEAAYFISQPYTAVDKEFKVLEALYAHNFVEAIRHTNAQQIIYLTNLLSLHTSETDPINVENLIQCSSVPVTILRTANIIGPGSIFFEVIQNLIERQSIIVLPQWIKNRCQPIALQDVLAYLESVLLNPDAFDQSFDIYGPEVLTYEQLFKIYAQIKKLKRWFITLPLTSRISAYWFSLVTSVSSLFTKAFIENMRYETISENNNIKALLPLKRTPYQKALKLALQRTPNSLSILDH